MASRSLGTLTLDLIAKIGGFTGPLDKAGRETQKQMAEIKKQAERLGTAVGATFAAIPAVVAGLVTSSASAAKEISNLSSLAGVGTTEFQRFAAAAASVGLNQDKLSDIFKDTNDKVGDFLATGGGELKNFFETVAPKVGVTADQFRKLNSADALQLYVTSLQKANVSQAQMTFFMEAIADEATALVPLLANGGKKFKELGDAAQSAGMIMDEQTIGAAQQFGTELTVIGQYANSAKTALAAEFMPVLAQLAKDLADTSKEAGGLRNVVHEFANDFIEVTATTASLADGIARAFKIAAATIVSGFSTTMAYLQSIGATANTLLGAITFGDMSKDFKKNAEQLTNDAIINSRTAGNGFDQELAGAGRGDKYKERLKERLAIEEDFNRQQRELVLQRNSGDLSQELYDQETQVLSDALAERLELQNDYYSQLDEAQTNWMDGVTSAWENFADAATDYSAMAADATTSTLGSARSELGSFLSDVATGAEDAGDALMDMVTGFAKSMIDTLADMAAQWLVYQAVQLLVGKSTQSVAAMGLVANAQATSFQAQLAAYASTAAIPIVGPALAPAAAMTAAMTTAPMVAGVASSALMGMAHNGLDNIPREGTWLLDGGERVLNPNQNRDLTQYLRNANDAGAGAGLGGGITINAPVTVQAQPGMSDEAARRQGEMMGQAFRQTIREVVNEEFAQGGSMWRR